jgi:hypothetical protein
MKFWVVAPCRLIGGWQATSLHGATTQKKNIIIILTAVKTSNLATLMILTVNRDYFIKQH